MIHIDGSEGEGGGQIVRSSLALSAVSGKPFEIVNLRGRRKKPGLLRQHLTCVKAAREVCGADVVGNELHSSHLTFAPGPIQARDFRFDIGSAGSSTLVAQTIIPALMLATDSSRITVIGGTHNMAAPPFDYLDKAFLPLLERMGPSIKRNISSYGFFPVGGGQIEFEIFPCKTLDSIELLVRDKKVPTPTVTALVSQLPLHIGEREVDVIARKAGWKKSCCQVRKIENSPGPGNVVMIELDFGNVTEVFTGFGRRDVKAEDVARKAYRQAKSFLAHRAPVGEFLADQLLLPMGLAASQGKTSRIRTQKLSLHSTTHIEILKMFLDIHIVVEPVDDDQFEITVCPPNE